MVSYRLKDLYGCLLANCFVLTDSDTAAVVPEGWIICLSYELQCWPFSREWATIHGLNGEKLESSSEVISCQMHIQTKARWAVASITNSKQVRMQYRTIQVAMKRGEEKNSRPIQAGLTLSGLQSPTGESPCDGFNLSGERKSAIPKVHTHTHMDCQSRRGSVARRRSCPKETGEANVQRKTSPRKVIKERRWGGLKYL